MKSLCIIVTGLLSISILPSILSAAEYGNAAEAKAMLERAVMAVEKDPEKALTDFTEGKEMFKEKDLYVFCFDMNTEKVNAHGAKASLIGYDVNQMKDKTGKLFGKELIKNAVEKEYREVSYLWPRTPDAAEPSPKSSYVTRVGDIACGVGYYK